MGRNLLPAQSHCLWSTFTESAVIINMQNYLHSSQTQTKALPLPLPPAPPPYPPPPPPLVCLREDVMPAERLEKTRGRDRKLKNPIIGHVTRDDKDAWKPDLDLPDVFEDSLACPAPRRVDSDPVPTTVQQQQQQHQQREDEDSVENIPSVPNIVIQYATVPAPATSSKTALPHSNDPVGLFAKKGRTHSDSVIYESNMKKQCLLSSLSGSRSLSCTPSGQHMACERDSIAENCSSTSEFASDKDRSGVTLGTLGQKTQFLKPISWNFCGLNEFTTAEEKSPKLFWLRRHSDSNVSNEDKSALETERRCTLISQRISEDARSREIDQESAKFRSEDSEKVLHWRGGVPAAEGCTPEEGRKCLKVKKYLQTRYQNQLVDNTDDVFMDVTATDSKSERQVMKSLSSAEASRSLSRRELIDSSSGGDVGNEEAKASSSPELPTCLISDTAEEEGYSSKAACGQLFLHADDDGVRRFQNNVVITAPVTSLPPPARQTIFDFSFPAAAYSILRDVPDCSTGGSVVFGLLPQSCFSTATFASSPLTVDNNNSFSVNSSSSPPPTMTLLSVSPVVQGVAEDYAVPSPDLVSESSKRRQLGPLGAGDCARRRRPKKKTDHSSGAFVESAICDQLDRPTCCPSPFLLLKQPSNNSTDGATCSGKNRDKDADMSSSSSPSTVVISSLASSQMLACPSSSSSSSPAVVTPTSKSSPQVVFDYQFSERINEQRDSGSFVCPVCASVYPSYNSLANHVVTHLPSEVIATDGANDSSKVHLCKVCNRSFSRSDMLSRHMRLHTGLRPYECHLCQQVFSRSDHLHTHLRTHTGEKPYRCSHCMYAASRRDMVTRHMRIHVRGGGKRGRRSSSTSSLASEAGQTSDDNGVFDNNTPGHHQTGRPARRRPVPPVGGGGGGKTGCSQQKQRNWSVASDNNNDGQDCCFEDKDLLNKMTRTESTTSIDSGVSYLTPRSLVPSLWSPGIDSPDVFSRYLGHFLWPSTSSSEIKHDSDRPAAANVSSRDSVFEMHSSFQKCQVVSPLEQRFAVNSNELLGDQQREEECV